MQIRVKFSCVIYKGKRWYFRLNYCTFVQRIANKDAPIYSKSFVNTLWQLFLSNNILVNTTDYMHKISDEVSNKITYYLYKILISMTVEILKEKPTTNDVKFRFVFFLRITVLTEKYTLIWMMWSHILLKRKLKPKISVKGNEKNSC